MAIGNLKAQAQQTAVPAPAAHSSPSSVSTAASPTPAVTPDFLASLFPPDESSGTPIPGTDCVILSSPPKPRVVCIIYGLDGHGKTSFVTGVVDPLTGLISGGCPDPIVMIGLDRRGKDAVYDAQKAGRTIYYLEAAPPANLADMSHEDTKVVASYVLERIKRNYNHWAEQARQDHWRTWTFCIDTGTVLTNLITAAVSGRPTLAKPVKGQRNDFPDLARDINFQCAYFANKARECGFNLVILSQAKAENWPAPDQWTHDVHKVFSQCSVFSAQVRLVSVEQKIRQATDEATATGSTISAGTLMRISKSGASFDVKVGPKSGLAAHEIGKVYTAADWGEDGPFAYTCSRLIPRTETSDWR